MNEVPNPQAFPALRFASAVMGDAIALSLFAAMYALRKIWHHIPARDNSRAIQKHLPKS
jgi:hypothetical protein